MHSGKHFGFAQQKKIHIRALLLTAAMMISLGGVTGGTFAMLVDKTPEVVNTFTYGDIKIDLTEDDTNDGDNDPTTNSYKMIPGRNIAKNPKVTVDAGSEDCWLFVILEKSDNFDAFMTFEIADGWTALSGQSGVYYRQVLLTDTVREFGVIKDNQVHVKETVTREMLGSLTEGGASHYPTLTIEAAAIQYDAGIDSIDTAEEAWAAYLNQSNK